MKLKYIMLEHKVGNITRRTPVMFFEPLTHVGMAELMIDYCAEIPPSKIVSAGFMEVDNHGRIVCFGESESLKARKLPFKPLEDDATTIAAYNYLHGIV